MDDLLRPRSKISKTGAGRRGADRAGGRSEQLRRLSDGKRSEWVLASLKTAVM